MEFEDEADYRADVLVKDRFTKYRGLKSFRMTDWNAYKDLPEEYEKIIIFGDYAQSFKTAMASAEANASFPAGLFVRILIKNVRNEDVASFSDVDSKPFILSTLFRYEQKLSVMQARVMRTRDTDAILQSKLNYEAHCGFRVAQINPLLSRIFTACTKTKMVKKVRTNEAHLCSYYGAITFPPAPMLLFRGNLTSPTRADLLRKRAFPTCISQRARGQRRSAETRSNARHLEEEDSDWLSFQDPQEEVCCKVHVLQSNRHSLLRTD